MDDNGALKAWRDLVHARSVPVQLIRWTPFIAVNLLAAAIWCVFYPGLLSPDSLNQYRQAVHGQFDDAHPPLMAICLALVFRAGGDIQHLMLFQCTAGLLGIYGLALHCVRTIGGRATRGAPGSWLALAVTITLLLPISPLAHHVMTFWKDVWLLIAFCWLATIWLWLYKEANNISTPIYACGLTGFLIVATLALLVRHNSLAVLPVFCGLFSVVVAKKTSWKIGVATCFLPLLVAGASKYTLERSFHVSESHFGNLVYVYELTGLCYYYPEIRKELPWTSQHLTATFEAIYCPGHYNRYGPCLEVDLHSASDMSEMRAEYWSAASRFPFQFARVKYENFRHHFIKHASLLLHAGVTKNEFGIDSNFKFARVRRWFTNRVEQTFHSPWRWLFAEHGTWVCAGLLFMAIGVVRWQRDAAITPILLVSLVPIFYYASYLIASLALDFRYMYPADIVVQVLDISCLYATALGCAVTARAWQQRRRHGTGCGHEHVLVPGSLECGGGSQSPSQETGVLDRMRRC
jgi:hypothetical protein